jgi:DNA-binding NarL/FixJ family response regulator
MDAITVLLVDDHRVVREGTRRLLEEVEDIKVVGEAEDGEGAVRLAAELRPDVIVMDIRLPGMSGLDATRRIRATWPDARVLALTAHDDDRYVFPLLEAGASGYLLKTASSDELVNAVRAVHAGQSVLHPAIAHKVLARLKQPAEREGKGIEELTEREMEVLREVATGASNQEVALRLHISPHTVQVHLSSIFSKLGVSSRTEATLYALKKGWITLNEEG